MTGRELYGMYRDSHSGSTGIIPGTFDDLTQEQKRVWESLSGDVREAYLNSLREHLVMWEPS